MKDTMTKHTLKYSVFSANEILKLHCLDTRSQRSDFPNMLGFGLI